MDNQNEQNEVQNNEPITLRVEANTCSKVTLDDVVNMIGGVIMLTIIILIAYTVLEVWTGWSFSDIFKDAKDAPLLTHDRIIEAMEEHGDFSQAEIAFVEERLPSSYKTTITVSNMIADSSIWKVSVRVSDALGEDVYMTMTFQYYPTQSKWVITGYDWPAEYRICGCTDCNCGSRGCIKENV